MNMKLLFRSSSTQYEKYESSSSDMDEESDAGQVRDDLFNVKVETKIIFEGYSCGENPKQ